MSSFKKKKRQLQQKLSPQGFIMWNNIGLREPVGDISGWLHHLNRVFTFLFIFFLKSELWIIHIKIILKADKVVLCQNHQGLFFT